MYRGFFSSRSYRYLNGNYLVIGNSDLSRNIFGVSKRTLRIGEDFKSKFPDSIDLKITNKCFWGCSFCHESSTPSGKTMNLEKTKEILSQLPEVPIEIAIGGGNVLECFPELCELTEWLEKRNNRVRITLNSKDLDKNIKDPGVEEIVNYLNKIEALGISLQSFSDIHKSKSTWLDRDEKNSTIWDNLYTPITVYHIIAGIFPLEDLRTLATKATTTESILILGYKQWGRAKNTELPNLSGWNEELKSIIKEGARTRCIGFDNLACEQLGIRDILGENAWKVCYMGDEGTCSMYIDAVEGKFARTSRSADRVSWNDVKLLDYYASLSR